MAKTEGIQIHTLFNDSLISASAENLPFLDYLYSFTALVKLSSPKMLGKMKLNSCPPPQSEKRLIDPGPFTFTEYVSCYCTTVL